ncbi:MAG: peptide/nickel transport system permease protein [Verrucomicrobiales bacterium]|jgi:peptide/nickel transport system permease protein
MMNSARLIVIFLFLGVLTGFAQEVNEIPTAGATGSIEEQKVATMEIVIRAATPTLLINLVAALITYTLAIVTAFSVLYFGRWTRHVLTQVLNTLACVSPLILLLIVYSALSPRGLLLGVFLGIAIYPLIGRQLLARVTEASGEFQFMQAKILGHSPIGVFVFYALPKFIPLTMPFFFFGFIYSLIMESMFNSLGLLDLKSDDTWETWGALIQLGADHLLDAPWQVFYPGIAIIITTLVASLLVPIFDRILSVRKA